MRKWNFQIPREEIVIFSDIIDGRSLGFYLIRIKVRKIAIRQTINETSRSEKRKILIEKDHFFAK